MRADRAMRPERYADILLVVLLCLACVFVFGDVASDDSTLLFRDHIDVFRPRLDFVRRVLLDGRLPVMPPQTAGGVPLEYQLNGSYLPFTLVLFAGPFDVTYDWYVIAHFVTLAAGTYGFARALGARSEEALVAAAVATLSGPVLSNENLLVAMHGLAFAPWVFWALLRVLRRPSLPDTAALALALGFQLQGTIPVYALLDPIAGLFLLSLVRPKHHARWIAAVVTATLVAFAIASIEVMPVIENLPFTRRGAGFAYGEASRWSVTPLQLLELIAPAVWAPPDVPCLNVERATGSIFPPYFTTLYFGSALALAAAALTRPRPVTLALVAVVLTAFAIALGPLTPLHRWFTYLPVLSSSRFPVKYTVIAAMGIAALAPIALRLLVERPKRLVVFAGVQAAVCLAVLAMSSTPQWLEYLASAVSKKPLGAFAIGQGPDDLSALANAAIQPRLVHGLLFAAVAAAVALLGRRTPMAVAAIILLDLTVAGRFAVFGGPVEPQAPPQPVLQLIEGRDHKIYSATPFGRKANFYRAEGETPFAASLRSANARGHNAYRHVRYFRDLDRDAQSALSSRLAFELLQHADDRTGLALLARAGVTWVSTWQPSKYPGTIRLDLSPEQPQFFYPVPGARGYVKAFERYRHVDLENASRSGLLETLTATTPEGLVFSPATGDRVACESTTTTTTSVSRRSPGLIEIMYSGGCDSLITVLETAMPGWQVTIDDRAAELWVAELGFMAVRVPAGEHRLLFRYHPRTTRWIPITLAGYAAALLGLIVGLVRRLVSPIGAS